MNRKTKFAAELSSKKRPRGRPNPNAIKPYQFRPGQSGNPGGQPKQAALRDAYRAKLESICCEDPAGRSWAEVIADHVADLALHSEKYAVSAAAEMADRTEGRPRQAIDFAGKLTSVNPDAILLAKLFGPEILKHARSQLARNEHDLNGGTRRGDPPSIEKSN